MSHVFITGFPRSGTTLLDKLLSSHPECSLLSQPLPLLYVQIKKLFLTEREKSSADSSYPLNDMFGENYYDPREFVEFLRGFKLTSDFCKDTLKAMLTYDGQYTKPVDALSVIEDFQLGSLFQFVQAYTERFSSDQARKVLGTKETFCEEYIPYLLSQGAKVILLVRDPRDVLVSLNSGQGELFGGKPKPHLFNVRQWRKSVCFGLNFASNADFLLLRYEDLVFFPQRELDRLAEFLHIAPFPPELVRGKLRGQDGALWESNSSHKPSSRIETASVGRYKESLCREAKCFVEALCFCEMKHLDYSFAVEKRELSNILKHYKDQNTLERAELSRYMWSQERFDEEMERFQCLRHRNFMASHFIFESAFRNLEQTF